MYMIINYIGPVVVSQAQPPPPGFGNDEINLDQWIRHQIFNAGTQHRLALFPPEL